MKELPFDTDMEQVEQAIQTQKERHKKGDRIMTQKEVAAAIERYKKTGKFTAPIIEI